MKKLTLLATSIFLVTAPLAIAADYSTSGSQPSQSADQASAQTKELKDGTKVEIGADNSVNLVNADGTKTPAPDGTHTLKDGTTLMVKDGKKVGGSNG